MGSWDSSYVNMSCYVAWYEAGRWSWVSLRRTSKPGMFQEKVKDQLSGNRWKSQ